MAFPVTPIDGSLDGRAEPASTSADDGVGPSGSDGPVKIPAPLVDDNGNTIVEDHEEENAK